MIGDVYFLYYQIALSTYGWFFALCLFLLLYLFSCLCYSSTFFYEIKNKKIFFYSPENFREIIQFGSRQKREQRKSNSSSAIWSVSQKKCMMEDKKQFKKKMRIAMSHQCKNSCENFFKTLPLKFKEQNI